MSSNGNDNVSNDKDDEVRQETEEISGPLVFSCGNENCKVILGDSYGYVTANEATKTITLSAASNITRSTNVFTSKSGHDVGSTYFAFSCSGCKASLGKYYLTTSKDLDDIREKFTFNGDALSTYELGKAKFGKIPEQEELEFGEHDTISKETSTNGSAGKLLKSHLNSLREKKISELESQILKMKHVIVDLAERVTVLESKDNSSSVPNLRQQSVSSMLNVSWIENANANQHSHINNMDNIYGNKRSRF